MTRHWLATEKTRRILARWKDEDRRHDARLALQAQHVSERERLEQRQRYERELMDRR